MRKTTTNNPGAVNETEQQESVEKGGSPDSKQQQSGAERNGGERRDEDRQAGGGGKGGVAKIWRNQIWYLLTVLILLWLWQGIFSQIEIQTIPYSRFKELLNRGQVLECQIKEDEIVGQALTNLITAGEGLSTNVISSSGSATVTNAVGPAGVVSRGEDHETKGSNAVATASPKEGASFAFRTIRVVDPDLISSLEKAGVKYTGIRSGNVYQFLLVWILPIGLMIFFWRFLFRRMGSLGQNMMSFGSSKAKVVADRDTGVTFDDVAGCDEAKYELQEVVDFLKNPDRYTKLGAKIPKGILLVGPPGTGKTLMARAVAGQAKVPFFLISGSEFVEMFVGVGAARVRDLFEKAKSQAPCIVFIDELDAVGRQRGVHMGAVNDEREQTLNQLLVGMDGFESNLGVIVLAATNRPEILDRALLRPGRFDRQVVLDAPDLIGRQAILSLHVRGKPLGRNADLRKIAQQTPGFSGADLANVINEAALLAARHQAKKINQEDLENAVEKVVAGPERKSRRLNEEEKRKVAFHEVGHALVALHSEHADPVHKISIVPRGQAALGYTLQLPAQDQYLLSRSALLDRIKGLLGGRAAEELVFGEVSTGAENDLQHATALARQMVAIYGMGEAVGLMHCGHRPGPFGSPLSDGYLQRDCSEETAREIDEEVKRILDTAYRQAKDILQKHREQLESVAQALLEKETLDAASLKMLIKPNNKKDHFEAVTAAPGEIG